MLHHDEFLELNQALRIHLGIYFPESRINILNSGLRSFMKEKGIGSEERFKHWLFGDGLSIDKIYELADFITNGETYFFREHRVFEVLSQQIIPELVKTHQTPLIWSAGCSSGEEPYSLAMLLLDYGVKPKKPIIFATDVNQNFLKRAEKGIYSNWSFRKVKPQYINKYFRKIDSRSYQISEEVKALVQFSRFNLVDDNWQNQLPFKESPHLIFCRNVLIYFTQENIDKVVQNFARRLHTGGYFISGSTEPTFRFHGHFQPALKNGLPIYQKRIITTSSSGKKDSRLEKISTSSSARWKPVKFTEKKNEKVPRQRLSFAQHQKRNHQLKKNLDKHPPLPSAEEIEKMLTRGENEAVIRLLPPKGDRQTSDEQVKHFLWLARAHANIGKKEDAASYCQKAISLNKFNPEAYYWLGVIELERNQKEKAKEYFQKSIYLNPNYASPYIMLAHINEGSDQSEVAKKHLVTALKILEKRPPEEIVYEADGSTVEALIKNLKTIMS